MSPTLTTFLFETVNFLVLAAVLGRLFFRPIRQSLKDRREQLEAATHKAAEHLQEAEQTKQQIARAHAKLQDELQAARRKELEAAGKQAQQIIAEARASAERELDTARTKAAQMSDTQRDVLTHAVVAAAAETVGRLLRQLSGEELQSALINAAIRQLASLPAGAIAPIRIESASPLSAAHHDRLVKALGSAAAEAEFRTAEDLMGGVRIATGMGLIDASVSGLAGFSRQALIRQMTHYANNHNPLQNSNDA